MVCSYRIGLDCTSIGKQKIEVTNSTSPLIPYGTIGMNAQRAPLKICLTDEFGEPKK